MVFVLSWISDLAIALHLKEDSQVYYCQQQDDLVIFRVQSLIVIDQSSQSSKSIIKQAHILGLEAI